MTAEFPLPERDPPSRHLTPIAAIILNRRAQCSIMCGNEYDDIVIETYYLYYTTPSGPQFRKTRNIARKGFFKY
jgi:hypothetical protein